MPEVVRRRTVLTRVLLSYVVITLSFALVAGYSVLGQRQSVRETELVRSGYMPLALALRDAVASQGTYNSQLNHITEVQNPVDKRVWFDSTLAFGRPQLFAAVRAALNQAFRQDPKLETELLEETAKVEQFLDGDREILQRLFAALRAGEVQRAEQARDALVTRGTQAATMLRLLENRVNLQVDKLISVASNRERWTLRVLLMWVVFTIAFGVAVGLYARRVLRPLVSVTERAKAVAAGDFSPRQIIANNDEIGELAHTFETMVAAISRANQELLDTERLATIGKMAAQVTHEVRNPLSSIALNLELLEDELVSQSEEVHALYSAIRKEVERLTELTEQYLSVARRNDPEFQLENLAEVANEALEFVKPDLARNGVRLERDFAEELPQVWLDDGQIRQVIHNLVRNARQAMPNGGTLQVKLEAETSPEETNPLVRLIIADEGVGIEPEMRDRLFQPFATNKSHGTGLGLAISRHIVETHHGRIRCEANAPRGTRFIVELPVSTEPLPRVGLPRDTTY
jgi:two-component system, NtrC family, sensor kinase